MKMFKLMMAAFMAVGLTLGIAGMASAAAITCGDCHSTPPVDGDNCTSNARELHGTHTNYSSASFPETVANYGKCAYCHTAVTDTAPTATHNNNAVEVDGSGSAMAPALSYNSGTATCTDACHNNDATTAKWGNYTAIVSDTIYLACNSCHDDSSSTPTIDLSGAHSVHLGSTVTTGTTLDNSDNSQCSACHPDNTSDLWSGGMADDGTVKAYPHASDGTNVVSANAASTVGFSGSGCTTACHTNSTTDVWGASQLTCTSCHYYAASPTAAANDASTVVLGGSHSAHFTQGKVCSDCHGTVPSAGDTSHVNSLPVSQDNATVTLAAGTWTDATNTCSNTGAGCHLTGDVVWGTTLSCDSCHNYPGATNDWSANNGHAVRYGAPVVNTHLPLATAFNASSDTYAAVTADASKCGKCHSGGTHQTGTLDVAGSGNNYCGVGDFTITVNVTGSSANCSNVSCHSGKTTPEWY